MHTPVVEWSSGTSQNQCYLSLPRVDDSKIIHIVNDHIKKLIVSDMGGHPRSLEILSDVLNESDDYSPTSITEEVLSRLKSLYGQYGVQTSRHPYQNVLH